MVDASTARETVHWADHLIPLPQEMAVSGEVRVAADEVGVVTQGEPSAMVREAVAALQAAYREKAGKAPTGAGFVVHVGLLSALEGTCDEAAADAQRLRETRNPEQAYVVRPVGRSGLVVGALEDRGLFYGVQTLGQLLTARLSAAAATVPLVTITDWPDFEERGLWNSGLRRPAHVGWLAGLKLNFEHINHPVNLDPTAPRCPPLPMGEMAHARRKAFHILPHCWHFDFWADQPAMRQHYPELVGKGESARNPSSVANPRYHPDARCPCTSGPLLRQVLTEWVTGAAAQGVREVSLWLTEYQPSRCGCDACAATGTHQLVREAQASIQAIQEARKQYPDLVGRVFLTFNLLGPEEERACRECLSLFPTDGSVRPECVYGLQAPFDEYARAGHWVGNYGIAAALGGSYRSRGASRLRLYADPERLRERVVHLREAGYSGVYNISAISVGGEDKGAAERRLCDFHLTMLAEWFWNASGRDVPALVRAWATRRNAAKAEAIAGWMGKMLAMAPATFTAVHAVPEMAAAIREGRALVPGQAPGLEAFPDEAGVEAMIQTAERCEAAAQKAGEPGLAAESRVTAGALRVVRSVVRLSRMKRTGVGKADEAVAEARAAVSAILAAAREQTALWTAVPAHAATALNEATVVFWRGIESEIAAVG